MVLYVGGEQRLEGQESETELNKARNNKRIYSFSKAGSRKVERKWLGQWQMAIDDMLITLMQFLKEREMS